MKARTQLRMKEEGQQSEKPPSALKIKVSSMRYTQGSQHRDANFQNNLHCQIFCLIHN